MSKWIGEPPSACQICHSPITDEFIDGRTHLGSWAFMCHDCHVIMGVGLGTGRGQLYKKNDKNEWEKIDG